MTPDELIAAIHKNVVLGRVDSADEGFDGDMEGEPGVTELVEQGLGGGVPIDRMLTEALSPAMEVVGQKYEAKEYLTPDMLASAECVSAAMDLLEPHLVKGDMPSRGDMLIATVEGDLHDIGKNIVATLLRGAGYRVKDLGVSVPADRIVEALKQDGPRFLGLSALLTSTMRNMQAVIERVEAEGLRQRVKIIVGGAPVSSEFAERIGADAYCRDAFDAIAKLGQLSAEAVA